MADLKLAKLPDRDPVTLSITLSPELNRKLTDYAEFYNETYKSQKPEKVKDLAPYILEAYLDSDAAFTKARKMKLKGARETADEALSVTPRQRQAAGSAASATR